MNLIDWVSIYLAKISEYLIRIFRLGAGATWPGEIALRINPGILEKLSLKAKNVIVVAGTNGKTTTVKMLETILRKYGLKVKHNESGANLDNGLVSAFIRNLDWSGGYKSDTFLFEIDEAVLPKIVARLHPKAIVLLNLFRDQLDRYGEVDVIARKWLASISGLPSTVKLIINADDPELAHIGTRIKNPVHWFGLEDPNLYLPQMQHATDSIYCPRCGQRLTFGGVYFSHLGKWACGKCGLTHPEVNTKSQEFNSPLEGVYNRYNTLAAAAVSRVMKIPDDQIRSAMADFRPAFGRMESVVYQGKKIRILLSKNPTGFNESVRTMINSSDRGPLLLVLNDRIPDGTDVSWIWDVDFEVLEEHRLNRSGQIKQIVVSGDRCYDMGLRLKYSGLSQNLNFNDHDYKSKSENEFGIIPDLNEAVNQAVKLTSADETLWILATYSAMLDVRKIITGRKIL
jgi:UDP-N-acetylmuramyl tripeptide synthase